MKLGFCFILLVIQYSESEERQINETGLFPRIMEAKYLLSSLNLKSDILYAFILVKWLEMYCSPARSL